MDLKGGIGFRAWARSDHTRLVPPTVATTPLSSCRSKHARQGGVTAGMLDMEKFSEATMGSFWGMPWLLAQASDRGKEQYSCRIR